MAAKESSLCGAGLRQEVGHLAIGRLGRRMKRHCQLRPFISDIAYHLVHWKSSDLALNVEYWSLSSFAQWGIRPHFIILGVAAEHR
jgi:hypothetical protein